MGIMEKNEIISKYPSLCWDCVNARKPAADSNRGNWFVGCCEMFRRRKYNENADIFDYLMQEDAVGEGWVDLRARIWGEKSGVITNYVPMVKGAKRCLAYEYAGSSAEKEGNHG